MADSCNLQHFAAPPLGFSNEIKSVRILLMSIFFQDLENFAENLVSKQLPAEKLIA